MADPPVSKLAVILHADVVGSTELVRLDETVADQRMQDAFRRFAEEIANHNGIAHEIRGDAVVAEFAKASDAVMASLAFQDANASRNDELPDEIRPVLRVGIALGEVLVTDNRMTGEGVVLAQRLEQLAEPGGVCLQDAAYQTVPKRLPFDYESLGDRELKGFDEPIRAYTARRKSEALIEVALRPEPDSLEVPEEPSIAVLPFANMSDDTEQEFFSDGITEDIITALSRISGLLVIARNSPMVYKGRAVDVKEVGREQGVRYVLEGSVRKAGNRVRVTAQLVDAQSGHHQWAERYDRELDDIFAVQDEITRQITVEMQVQLTSGEGARLRAGGTDNFGAWRLVCQANDLPYDVKEDNIVARSLVAKALDIDPNYVSGWALLGWTHWATAVFSWTDSRESSIELALDAAHKALALQEDSPEALDLLGRTLLIRGDVDKAVEILERAALLAPNNAGITDGFAICLTFAGRASEAIEKSKRAMRLSPRAPGSFYMTLGLAYSILDQQQLAIQALKQSVEMEPSAVNTRAFLIRALLEAGDDEEAKSAAQEILRLEPKFSVSKFWSVPYFKHSELNESYVNSLRRSGLPD